MQPTTPLMESKFNTLTFTVSTDNWHLSPVFELVVDGKPLPEWLDDGNDGIPNWLTLDGLPAWPLNADGLSGLKLVTVCGCGEPGCGHSHCSAALKVRGSLTFWFAKNMS